MTDQTIAKKNGRWLRIIRFILFAIVMIASIMLGRLSAIDMDLRQRLLWLFPTSCLGKTINAVVDANTEAVVTTLVCKDGNHDWADMILEILPNPKTKASAPNMPLVPNIYDGLFERYGRNLRHFELQMIYNNMAYYLEPMTDWSPGYSPYGTYVCLPPGTSQTCHFRIRHDKLRRINSGEYRPTPAPPAATGLWCRVLVHGGRVALPPRPSVLAWQGTAVSDWVLLPFVP